MIRRLCLAAFLLMVPAMFAQSGGSDWSGNEVISPSYTHPVPPDPLYYARGNFPALDSNGVAIPNTSLSIEFLMLLPSGAPAISPFRGAHCYPHSTKPSGDLGIPGTTGSTASFSYVNANGITVTGAATEGSINCTVAGSSFSFKTTIAFSFGGTNSLGNSFIASGTINAVYNVGGRFHSSTDVAQTVNWSTLDPQ